MTVEELITLLQKMPKDHIVVLEAFNPDTDNKVTIRGDNDLFLINVEAYKEVVITNE